LETIAKRLERVVRHVVVLRGGQSEKQRGDIAAPGFTRGFDRFGNVLFVGLSRTRDRTISST